MKCFFAATLLLCGASLAAPAQQVADDNYILIYNLIQTADKAASSGQPEEAMSRYIEAQAQLDKLRQAFPDWNPNIIKYRQGYLADKMSALQGPATATKSAETTSPSPSAAAAEKLREALDQLNAQLQAAQAQNATLSAKLKEALSVQPAAADPAELTRAQDQIRSLAKENELLKTAPAQKVYVADTNALAQSRQALSEAQAQIAALKAAGTASVQEKSALQKRIEELTPFADQLKTTRTQLAALQADAEASAQEKKLLQKRIAELAPLTGQLAAADARITALKSAADSSLQENQVLQKRITELSRKAETELSALTARLSDASAQLASLKSTADAAVKEKKLIESRLAQRESQSAAEIAGLKSNLTDASGEIAKQKVAAEASAREKDSLLQRIAELSKGQKPDFAAITAKLAAAEAKIAQLKTAADAGAREKKSLEKQVKELTASQKPDASKLAEARARIEALQAAAEAGVQEKKDLEKRVDELADSGSKLKKITEDRDRLLKRLEATSQKISLQHNDYLIGKVSDLNAQVKTLEARLEVAEAKPVPYSTAELALFKQTPPAPQTPDVPKPAETPQSSSPAATTMSASTSQLVASAKQHFFHHELDQAEADYQKILEHDQNNGLALANLATIEIQENKLADAEKHINAALAQSPNDAYNLSTFGYLKFRQEKLDEALNALSRAAALDSNNPEIQNYLGVTLSHKGQRAQGETALRKAIQSNPHYAPAHNNLAVIYLSQTPSLPQLANWHYQKALADGQPRNLDLEKRLEEKGVILNP